MNKATLVAVAGATSLIAVTIGAGIAILSAWMMSTHCTQQQDRCQPQQQTQQTSPAAIVPAPSPKVLAISPETH